MTGTSIRIPIRIFWIQSAAGDIIAGASTSFWNIIAIIILDRCYRYRYHAFIKHHILNDALYNGRGVLHTGAIQWITTRRAKPKFISTSGKHGATLSQWVESGARKTSCAACAASIPNTCITHFIVVCRAGR